MANAYTTEAAIEAIVGVDLLTTLLDRDGDGTRDTGVMTAAIERAGRTINLRLRQRYGSSVPFAQVTDSPATPDEIQEIAKDLVLYYLFNRFEPSGRDAEEHREQAFDALEALRKGEADISVARAKAHEGATIAVYTASDPVYSGVDTSDVSRLRGI